MAGASYRDLDVWKMAMGLAKNIYQATEAFPKSKTYGLAAQMRRATVSTPSNIAEGWGRTRNEYIHFVTIAHGSGCELETQVILAQNLGFISEEILTTLLADLSSINRMLKALVKSLKKTL